MRIRAEKITKKFGQKKVLSGVDFSAAPSKITVLIGPNGAGKTTLLRIIGLLETADAGGVFYDGTDALALSGAQKLAFRRKIGMTAQSPAVFSGSVWYNVRLPLVLRGNKDFAPALEAAREAGLEKLLENDAKKLSGGERQRLSIARALAAGPEVFILDEPAANLDPLSQKITEDLIVTLKRRGKTVILATHSMLQARKIADDVYFIDAGKVLQSGPAEDVFSRPAAHFVAEFTGTRNVLMGLLYPDAAFKTGGLVIQTVPDETLLEKAVQSGAPVPAVATLGPEEILVSTGTVASSARNCLKATVKEVRRAGRVDEIIAEAGGVIFMALVTRQSTEQMSIVPGKEIYLTFKATSVNVIPA